MKKFNINTVLIIILSILIVIVVFLALKTRKKAIPGTKEIIPDDIFPLKYGSTGKAVMDIQAYLNKKYNSGLDVDGIFGPLTEAAVKTAFGSNIVSKDLYNSIKTA
ncbi:MAG: peptidoglycan-binding domain-containing protein [Candidatus Nanoarchaeia archaeon]|nr:peptidoglycan-binding domain-containing protein [Candidatus Nanoarchaeia archaeon]